VATVKCKDAGNVCAAFGDGGGWDLSLYNMDPEVTVEIMLSLTSGVPGEETLVRVYLDSTTLGGGFHFFDSETINVIAILLEASYFQDAVGATKLVNTGYYPVFDRTTKVSAKKGTASGSETWSLRLRFQESSTISITTEIEIQSLFLFLGFVSVASNIACVMALSFSDYYRVAHAFFHFFS
jgi:hypothetical protein